MRGFIKRYSPVMFSMLLLLALFAGCGAPAPVPTAAIVPTEQPTPAAIAENPAVTPAPATDTPYESLDADGRIAAIGKIKDEILADPKAEEGKIAGEAVEPLLRYYAAEGDARVKRAIEECLAEKGLPQAMFRAYTLNPEVYRAAVSDIVCATGWTAMTMLMHYVYEEYPSDPWQYDNKPLLKDLFTKLQDRYPVTKYIEEWNTDWSFPSDLVTYLKENPDPSYVDTLISFAARCPVVEDTDSGLAGACFALSYFPLDDRIVDFYVDLVTVKHVAPVVMRNTDWYTRLPAGAYGDAFLGKKPGGFNKDKIAVIKVFRESAKAKPGFSFAEYSFYNVPKEKRLSVQDLYCAKTAIYIDYVYAAPTPYTSEIGSVTGYRSDCVVTKRNLATGKILFNKTIKGFDLKEKEVVSNTEAKEIYGQPDFYAIEACVLSLLK